MSDRPPRVLVVEDDQEIAQVLLRSLRMEGYEARASYDGEAALADAREFTPDLVILDLGLPKLDGVDVARALRKDGGDVPILMLTARDAVEARVEGLDAGADDYLVKPFERQELLARLRALLRRRPPRGSASLVVGDLQRCGATGARSSSRSASSSCWSTSCATSASSCPVSACSRRYGVTIHLRRRTPSRSSYRT
jgi:DNA-binding response OmpR family regulator